MASEKKAAEAAIEAERSFAEAAALEAEAAKQKLLQVRRTGLRSTRHTRWEPGGEADSRLPGGIILARVPSPRF